jgi:hypothetical protein
MLNAEEVNGRISRHLRFWGEKWDGEGAYFSITATDGEAVEKNQPLRVPPNLEDRWFDVDFRIKETMWKLKTTHYAGDAVPVAYAHFGPANLSGLLGAGYTLTPDTIFFGIMPMVFDWNRVPDFRIEREGRLYRAIQSVTNALADIAEGRFIIGISDIGSNLDTLTCLRDRAKTLADLVTEPNKVQEMFKKIFVLWKEFYNENRSWVTSRCPYMSAPSPLVFDGKWCKVESESAVMISPAMFEEFILPLLRQQTDFLDRAIFNLDSYDFVKHLPVVLTLAKLHAVAWNLVGEYDPRTRQFCRDYTAEESIQVCRAVQLAGKKLVLQQIAPAQVEPLFRRISPDGVFLFLSCKDKKEADALAAFVRRWQNQ